MQFKGFLFFLFLVLVDTLSNPGKGASEKYFCKFFLKYVHWPSKDLSIFSSGGHFVWQSRTISALAILVKGHTRNISVKSFSNRAIGLGGNIV